MRSTECERDPGGGKNFSAEFAELSQSFAEYFFARNAFLFSAKLSVYSANSALKNQFELTQR
jgi:hypothetical protein